MKTRTMLTESEQQRWTIIVITLPVGAVLAFIYAFQILAVGETLGGWASLAFSLVVLGLWGAAIFRRDWTPRVEWAFFLAMILYLCLMTIENVNLFAGEHSKGEVYFSDVLNAIILWLAITLIASYLALPDRETSLFLIAILAGMTAAFLYHMLFKDGFRFSVILIWVQSFFALFVLVLLITQMGRLHKKYISTDDLTQVCNRREIYRVLQRELSSSVRIGRPFSLILFDVDHFKRINDTHGHMAGDRVLRETAELVSRSIRSMDCLGRWGGEEFLLVLPQTDLTAATLLAERLRELLSRRSFEGVNCVTASFGVTSFRAGQELEDLLHAADRAMYRAKQNGRNQVVVEPGG